jgi:hypothetical protein
MSLAAAALVASVAGTAMSAYSEIQQGKEQQQWSEYNAAVAERDAASAKQSAEYEAGQKRKETQKLLGRQRALYGKAGVTLEGSPLLMMEETASEGEIDALMIEREGKLRAGSYQSEAALSRMKGSAAKRAGYYGAGSSLLTGAGSAMSAYGAKVKPGVKP